MSRYRRNYLAGGTFFFTVKLADPKSRLLVEHIDLLREAYASVQKRYPFETVAICVMPNHLHAIWTLPDSDGDYSLRWRLIKIGFSNHFSVSSALSSSKQRRHEKGIWQRRFYEHTVRDDADLQRCVDYVHFNPVKHGFAASVKDWPFSSFHRFVRDGLLPPDWGGTHETLVMNFGE
ncbi:MULTISPECIES: transposase [unclassified Neisseria]|uniref:REP-associated tyrosine transposase n=1 Tax=unclassified Neisseria TaxID=2623750 RepID=UPI002665D681|nr:MULTISPECIES: transposase [unclassified Neisseria]MDO1509210.1 transposase [Neisseria sp. MVDL19-042950]MDO1515511.1 transposase [Neisseria sp. MVDL18-041461]MDO1562870.1 transposase [Neisseria sp. MVDL20-010259]